jgi:hypothetical protein
MARGGLFLGLGLALTLSAGAQAAALTPLGDSVRGVSLAQVLGTADLLGEWKVRNGNLRLVQVMTRGGGECEAGGDDNTAQDCPRFTLFLVANGETSGPVDFALYQLPETLGWVLPDSFTPDAKGEASVVPLDACEMKPLAKGFGWKGTSYRLTVKGRLVGGRGPNFLFDVSLDKLPGERPNCAAR